MEMIYRRQETKLGGGKTAGSRIRKRKQAGGNDGPGKMGGMGLWEGGRSCREAEWEKGLGWGTESGYEGSWAERDRGWDNELGRKLGQTEIWREKRQGLEEQGRRKNAARRMRTSRPMSCPGGVEKLEDEAEGKGWEREEEDDGIVEAGREQVGTEDGFEGTQGNLGRRRLQVR